MTKEKKRKNSLRVSDVVIYFSSPGLVFFLPNEAVVHDATKIICIGQQIIDPDEQQLHLVELMASMCHTPSRFALAKLERGRQTFTHLFLVYIWSSVLMQFGHCGLLQTGDEDFTLD